ncbi:Hypothetical predicted protein [Mytilus galloprovincialis]|uniref:B box-type domain-containing protein n=1 Tax=Mytilus galloprovincialis TaxID=29158 RepID=A0A8B6F9Q1_MYTGA|nr:Hypothetical predicted protein [Mytilus galloprovincialis]
MAFSQSTEKAQAPAMCQFCEESPEIKWKCVNCDLFLCKLCCSKIHSKSKASMEHEIINLKDIDTENLAKTMRKVDLQNLQYLDAKWKLSENIIKIELSALKQNGDELEIRKNNLYQVLQTKQVTDIFSTTQTLDKSIPKYSVKQIKQCETKFIPNTRQLKMGSNILGDLYSVPDFEVIKKYQSNNKNVKHILFCDDSTAFILSNHGNASHKLQKVKFENDNTKVERDIDIIVNDMEKTHDGEILVSSGEGDIKLYTKDGTFLKTFMTFTPLKTLGLHVTNNIR